MTTCAKCVCKARYLVNGVLLCGRHCRTSDRTPGNEISGTFSRDVVDSIYSSPSSRTRIMLRTPSMIRTPQSMATAEPSIARSVVVARSLIDIGTSPLKFDLTTETASSPMVIDTEKKVSNTDTASSPMAIDTEKQVSNTGTSPMVEPVSVQTTNIIEIETNGFEGRIIINGNLPSEPKYLHIYLSVSSVVPSGKNTVFFPSLSSENLGSIVLPNGERCVNLENLWEFSKVSPSLVDDKGTISEAYYEIRKSGFEDSVYNYYTEENGAFFLFRDRNNNEKRYTFLEAKFFFCHYYELLVRNKPDFLRLRTLREERFNLQIAGSIFVNEAGSLPRKSPIEFYIQDKENFDQSMILYCMLTIDDPNNYPWRVAARFGDLYKDMI